jgi:hypothetical protein
MQSESRNPALVTLVAPLIVLVVGMAVIAAGCRNPPPPQTLRQLAQRIAIAESRTTDDILRALNTASTRSGRSADDLAAQWSDDIGRNRPLMPTLQTRISAAGSAWASSDDIAEATATRIVRGAVCDVMLNAVNTGFLPTEEDVLRALANNFGSETLPRIAVNQISRDVFRIVGDINQNRPDLATLHLAALIYC